MKISGYVACICEGGAEAAIIDILLDEGLLVFSRENMLEEKVLRGCRNAGEFERRYLGKGFAEKISVIRILDSHRENFKLSKAYRGKIDVINVVTAPEIEMLIIHSEGRFDAFKRSGKKPNTYCKEELGMRSVKSYAFVRAYFKDTKKLLAAIHAYKKHARLRKGEYTLEDLLKVS